MSHTILDLQSALNKAYNKLGTTDENRARQLLKDWLVNEKPFQPLAVKLSHSSFLRYPFLVQLEQEEGNWHKWLCEQKFTEDEVSFARWIVEERCIPMFREEWNQQHLYFGVGSHLPGLHSCLPAGQIGTDTFFPEVQEYVQRTLSIMQMNNQDKAELVVCLSSQLVGRYQAVSFATPPIKSNPPISYNVMDSMRDSRRIWCTPPSNLQISISFDEDKWFSCEVTSRGIIIHLNMSRKYAFTDRNATESTDAADIF